MGDTAPIPGHSRELSGSANLTVLLKVVPDQPLLPWQRKFENFNRQLTINRLVCQCAGDTTPIPGPSRGLSGSANLTVLLKFVSDQPLLPWQRKFENFNRKLAIIRLLWEIRPPFLPCDAMRCTVFGIVILSVRLSVCPSVCHTRGLCPHGLTYDHDFITIW